MIPANKPTGSRNYKDRHLPRNGISNPKGTLKKDGAGQHNWGKPTDMLKELDEHYEYFDEMPQYNKDKVENTKAAETDRDVGRLKKIQVINPEEFETLRTSINSSQ